jgi:hypothetical protein
MAMPCILECQCWKCKLMPICMPCENCTKRNEGVKGCEQCKEED